jgi:hypothetical protein
MPTRIAVVGRKGSEPPKVKSRGRIVERLSGIAAFYVGVRELRTNFFGAVWSIPSATTTGGRALAAPRGVGTQVDSVPYICICRTHCEVCEIKPAMLKFVICLRYCQAKLAPARAFILCYP